MLKIKKITIENFRGLRLPLEIDFKKNNTLTSAVLYGRNGTAKSSIVDAWEWLNTFEINNLNREGVSLNDIPHKACGGKNCYISVEFEHPTVKTVKANFNTKKITAPILTGEYNDFRVLGAYPNYLRYSDLQSFVFKTKTDRYKYIARFFGLEKFLLLQDTIQASITRLTSQLDSHRASQKEYIKTVSSITGLGLVTEEIVVNFINVIGAKHAIDPIGEFKAAEKIKTALGEIVQVNPVARELSEWKAFQAKQNLFYPVASGKSTANSLETLFLDLKSNEENIKQLVLSSLYKLSIEVLPKLENKSKCPVCDTEFSGDLLLHIADKHASLDELNKKKTQFDNAKNSLEKQLEALSKKIAAIHSEGNTTIGVALNDFFESLNKINASLPALTAILKTPLHDLTTLGISSDPAIDEIETLIVSSVSHKRIVSEKVLELSQDEKTRTLAQDYANLTNVIAGYKSFLVSSEKVSYLESIHSDFEEFFALLTTHIQNKIQSIFSAISNDVVEIFNVIESANPFIKNPVLKLLTGKDKAVELEIEFASEKITPAFKFLSESQVNSFGMAIFLAAVKHFNSNFKFFILDDVVNSFDSYKRPKVAQLIATKFSEYQVLLLTHDQIFFEIIQKEFPEWRRYKFTGWDYSTGPKFKLSKSYAEEIQAHIDDDEPIKAGQTLGRYLEWIFGTVNENLETPLRYKTENQYTLNEFYEPMVKRLKEKLKQPNKEHKLVSLFDDFESGTIFRNYCVHYKNEVSPFTSPEIDTMFKKWLEIEDVLHCSVCKSFARLTRPANDEYLKCNCGVVDLKNVSLYAMAFPKSATSK